MSEAVRRLACEAYRLGLVPALGVQADDVVLNQLLQKLVVVRDYLDGLRALAEEYDAATEMASAVDERDALAGYGWELAVENPDNPSMIRAVREFLAGAKLNNLTME